MGERTYDLEERLLGYAAALVRLTKQIEPSAAGKHIRDQVLRSGTSPYLHHGEAEAAESARDFVHKLGVCLKELRETRRALRLVAEVPLIDNPSKTEPLLAETEELIKIFFASIRTANKKVVRENRDSPYGEEL